LICFLVDHLVGSKGKVFGHVCVQRFVLYLINAIDCAINSYWRTSISRPKQEKALAQYLVAFLWINHLGNASYIKNVCMQTHPESNNLYDPASYTFIEIGSHLCR
jgi:hypothetical protein